jgi:hypothetical protein
MLIGTYTATGDVKGEPPEKALPSETPTPTPTVGMDSSGSAPRAVELPRSEASTTAITAIL